MGRFAPGFSHVSELISDMWRDAITNKATSGYLGKTSTLVGTDDENCNVMIWISYWKSIEHPQRFANGDSHRKGWDSYLRGEHPHLGIMHETYDVPAGNWETICHNFTQFGLGKTEQLINPDPEVKPDSTSKENYTSSLVEAKGASWKSNDKASFGIPGITLGNRPVPLHPDDW
ncbi:hypothetical protein OCU04_005343 [Sclerotinia nivalis]|uniref:Uncharacterized protein n=1 Tax=Sclerotinia nivalis TaxID=352851 RepID=A0A9X0ANZ6_9HELO|nr:hypothetical protein OCU04_005343 [Sclerotinia nivalis]